MQILRQQTAADHLAVEGAVPLMHPGLTVAQYVQCLQQIYGVVAAWEERAAQVAPEWLQPTLIARRRVPLLEQDLAWFGAAANQTMRPSLPEMTSLPNLLGTMYVIEGSTLGGQFIARHVTTALRLNQGQGNAYFRANGPQTSSMWKEFCAILESKIPEDQTADVVASAKAMFLTFGQWMQGNPAMNGS